MYPDTKSATSEIELAIEQAVGIVARRVHADDDLSQELRQ